MIYYPANNNSKPKTYILIINNGSKNHPRKIANPAMKIKISKMIPTAIKTVLIMTPNIREIKLKENADKNRLISKPRPYDQ